MPGMVERGQGLLLFALVAGNVHLDMGMAGIGADLHFRYVHRREPGIAHFEAYYLGKLFPDSFGNALDTMFIHKKPSAASDRLSAPALPG